MKTREFHRFLNKLFRFRYQSLFKKNRLIRFVNDLKINGFCHSLQTLPLTSVSLTELCPALSPHSLY